MGALALLTINQNDRSACQCLRVFAPYDGCSVIFMIDLGKNYDGKLAKDDFGYDEKVAKRS